MLGGYCAEKTLRQYHRCCLFLFNINLFLLQMARALCNQREHEPRRGATAAAAAAQPFEAVGGNLEIR